MTKLRSSHHYVAMSPKHPVIEDFFPTSGRLRVTRIPVKSTWRCDHGDTICATLNCIEGWANVYYIDLERTVAGRRIKGRLGL